MMAVNKAVRGSQQLVSILGRFERRFESRQRRCGNELIIFSDLVRQRRSHHICPRVTSLPLKDLIDV